MNRSLHNCVFITIIALVSHVSYCVVPYLSFRSQGFDAARELAGWQTMINRPEMCTIYGSFSVTPEYTRSFRAHDIADYFFGPALVKDNNSDSCPTFFVQGTKAANRDERALMAENFYLPTDFKSEVSVFPTVDNLVIDFNFYLGMDEWLDGSYFRIHMPIVYSRWDLNFNEHVIDPGANNYDPGYFNNTYVGNPNFTDSQSYGIKRSSLLENFTQYAYERRTVVDVKGITYKPLERARMSPCQLTKTSIAELTAAMGWNFINCPDYTLGIQVRTAAPTGNRPEGYWLFEPVVGNGMHWEFGFGIDARWHAWQSCNECHNVILYLDANVTHLFSTRQCRTFDLKNKPLSRYMLALAFNNNALNLEADNKRARYQFNGTVVPVANFTTMPVDETIAAQADIVFDVAYRYYNWQFDVGYDFWGRSCENLCRGCDCCCDNGFKENTYGLKGDAFICGFPGTYDGAGVLTGLGEAVPLSATESNATIYKGTNNWSSGINGVAWNQNPGIDSPKNAFDGSVVPDPLLTHIIGTTDPVNFGWTQVKTSYDPVLITSDDIDTDGARTKGISNKIFGAITYIACERDTWTPYCSLGASVELGLKKDRQSSDKAFNTCCATCSLSQWGIWFKGGVSFE